MLGGLRARETPPRVLPNVTGVTVTVTGESAREIGAELATNDRTTTTLVGWPRPRRATGYQFAARCTAAVLTLTVPPETVGVAIVIAMQVIVAFADLTQL